MPKGSLAALSFYYQVMRKLEELNIPYVIIGGFAATMFGITRVTLDIDMVLDLQEHDIQALADAFPLPRYYADPYQMRNAVEKGMSFNIIDSTQGEKVDLFPVTMDPRYRPALERRIRRQIESPGTPAYAVWVARPEDVIVGKFMAWQEGRSSRQTDDIFEMMLAHFLAHPAVDEFDYEYVAQRVGELDDDVLAVWELLRDTAKEIAESA